MEIKQSLWSVAVFSLFLSLSIQAQDNSPFIEKTFVEKWDCDISMRHLIHLPEGYDAASKKWALLLYLHGGMGRGNGVLWRKPPGLSMVPSSDIRIASDRIV